MSNINFASFFTSAPAEVQHLMHEVGDRAVPAHLVFEFEPLELKVGENSLSHVLTGDLETMALVAILESNGEIRCLARYEQEAYKEDNSLDRANCWKKEYSWVYQRFS